MVPSEVGDGNAGDSANQQYLKKSKSTEDKRISKFGPRLGKLVNLYSGDTKSTGQDLSTRTIAYLGF
jgi:hypothetical protein